MRGAQVQNRNVVGGNQGGHQQLEQRWNNETPSTLKITDPIGPEFEAVLVEKYRTIYGEPYKKETFGEGGKKMPLQIIPKTLHPHPAGAFLRKFADKQICFFRLAKYGIIDVGGHVRTMFLTDEANPGHFLDERVHSLTPILDCRDEQRFMDWKLQAYNSGREWRNRCLCKAEFGPICRHVLQFDQQCRAANRLVAFKSIDSLYYDGVFDYIVQGKALSIHAHRNDEFPTAYQAPCYAAFHDLSKAYRDGGRVVDDEASISFRRNQFCDVIAEMSVKGNPDVYCHKVIDVPANCDSWQIGPIDVTVDVVDGREVVMRGLYVHMEIVWRMSYGSHDYVVCKIDVHTKKYSEHVPTRAKLTLTHKVREEVVVATKDLFPKKIDKKIDIFINRLSDPKISACRASYDPDDDTITYFARRPFIDKFLCFFKFKRRPTKQVAARSLVFEAIEYLAGISDVSTLKKKSTAFMALKVRSKVMSVDDMNEIESATIIAYTYSANVLNSVLSEFNHNEQIKDLKQNMTGTTLLPTIRNPWEPLLTFFMAFVVCLGVFLGISKVMNLVPVVQAATTEVVVRIDYVGLIVTAFVVALTFSIYRFVKMKKYVPHVPEWLFGSTVTIPNRLNLDLNKGWYDPNFRFKDPSWNYTHLKHFDDQLAFLNQKKEKIEAWRVSPVLMGEKLYTPTVKNTDKANSIAAAIRQTSSKIRPGAIFEREFLPFLRNLISEEILNFNFYSEAEESRLDWDQWLSKYPAKYRDEMWKQIDNLGFKPSKIPRGTMPKKEKNVTPVEHDLKDTELNDVKERNITTANPDAKPVNIVCDWVERYCERNLKGYCPGKNYCDLQCHLHEQWQSLCSPLAVEADGSGFDMTQNWESDQLIYDMIITMSKHLNLPPGLDWSYVQDVLYADKGLVKCTLGYGAVTFRAAGRKSGDGWTTLANTILQTAYWRFALFKAGVPNEEYFINVKGDDVIIFVESWHKVAISKAVSVCFAPKNDHMNYGLGQVCKKVVYTDDIEQITFLSVQFAQLGDGSLHTVRIFDRFKQMLPYSIKIPPGLKEDRLNLYRRQLCYLNGLCIMAWGSQIPIVREIALMCIRIGVKVDVYDAFDKGLIELRQLFQTQGYSLSELPKVASIPVDDYTYQELYYYLSRHYGLTGTEYQSIIQQCRDATWETSCIVSTFFDRV